MKRLELRQRMRQEMRGILKMGPLLLAALALAAILWGTDSAANSGLFQSSPVEAPPTLTPTRAAAPSVTATDSASSLTPLASASVTVTVALTETATAVETPTQPPAETATATLTPTEPPPTDTPVAPAASETAEPEATSDESERYPEGESKLKFEWGMLFDSAALFFSYVWLCCGILVFIAVPVLFFVVWRASSRRGEGKQEEAQQEKD